MKSGPSETVAELLRACLTGSVCQSDASSSSKVPPWPDSSEGGRPPSSSSLNVNGDEGTDGPASVRTVATETPLCCACTVRAHIYSQTHTHTHTRAAAVP